MSEKIYVCLLRLFPSAFRERYEEEALQLLRDRLRDEKSFFPRLRLTFNLIADTVVALPQAYRNSYADSATASPHFEGAPLFQALHSEPIRPAAIALAGVISLTALVTFAFMMGRSTPYRSAAPNGPRSPIESVIQRLNQTISPDSTDSAGPGAAEPTSANTGRSEAQPPSKTTAVSSSGPRSAASAASRPSQSRTQNGETSHPDQQPSPAAAVSSTPRADRDSPRRNTKRSPP
jgi:hypothetical protein